MDLGLLIVEIDLATNHGWSCGFALSSLVFHIKELWIMQSITCIAYWLNFNSHCRKSCICILSFIEVGFDLWDNNLNWWIIYFVFL